MKLQKTKHEAMRLVGEYLSYNRTEQRGTLVLCLLLLTVMLVNAMIPAGTFHPPPGREDFDAEVRRFELAWRQAADSDSIARNTRYQGYGSGYGRSRTDSLKFPAKRPVPVILVELNAADTFDLQQLRGIGPGFARRIVGYRERLRGYAEKRQILEVFGMDSARYLSIEEQLRVNTDSIHPFDLNTVTFKELIRHPYFPFPVTKKIMLYRQKNKVFRSLDELKKVEGVSDSLFSRMVIYLRLGP
jgi:DNA uptake protein ComE-like DNA-binding protein